jgi:phage I-like protein
MSLARDINTKLDEIIDIKKELTKLKKELKAGAKLTTLATGKTASKDEALEVVHGMIDDLKAHLNKLTNNGQNIRGIFNNEFYINDMLQDKKILKESRKRKK